MRRLILHRVEVVVSGSESLHTVVERHHKTFQFPELPLLSQQGFVKLIQIPLQVGQQLLDLGEAFGGSGVVGHGYGASEVGPALVARDGFSNHQRVRSAVSVAGPSGQSESAG
jgi:hypothetical protein